MSFNQLSKKVRALAIIVGAGLVITAGYTNCADVQFGTLTKATDPSNSDLGTNDPNDNGGPSDNNDPDTGGPQIPNLPDLPNVQKACTQGNIQRKTITVQFKDPESKGENGRCEWGVNGNNPWTKDQDLSTDERFNARVEQDVNFQLEPNTKICGMEFNFPEQAIYYDDEFFLVYNDVVLGSSSKLESFLSPTNGFMVYDWSKIVGRKWQSAHGANDIYCFGKDRNKSSCTWPPTSERGQISMAFHQDLLQEITARNVNRTNHQFKFITTGDNNRVDCQHLDISFEVVVSYSRE